ncbi:MAG: 23S rRNA (pseudouridine(1915)-N(3))-methyltransferase RlmH [Peptostreptococcaceae bacterium]|nr:23S rRNA (pseudouridine(1915)-N(3))-methyltransferase RlmH [Peptostreptococcaceae bacterium]
MNITIITVGKMKEKFMRDAAGEYTKRLSKYCKLSFAEVPDKKAPENLSEKEEIQVKDKEGEEIFKKIKDAQFVIALDIQGKQLSSEEFSRKLNSLALSGKSDLAFVIGGSLGLSEAVLDRADFKLSFSKMTFPHQLMKVILLEQIYRSFRISKNEPYHK